MYTQNEVAAIKLLFDETGNGWYFEAYVEHMRVVTRIYYTWVYARQRQRDGLLTFEQIDRPIS